VSVIDAASNSVVATPIVSGSPNGVVASPDGNAVYVTAYNGSAVAVIDSSTNTVVTSIGTGSLTIAVDYARIKP
jgi:YVTN family beta-propeller protein